jgi:hypothetical protein
LRRRGDAMNNRPIDRKTGDTEQGGLRTMFDADDVVLWHQLNQLMSDYWADVDHNGGLEAHEFYLPDGLYAIANNRFEGRAKIEAFYARRRFGVTSTRHVLSNLRTFRDDPWHARALGLMSLYRATGDSPFQGARPPAMIADFEARCALSEGQRWRFETHVLQPFIVGSDMPASIVIRPRSL